MQQLSLLFIIALSGSLGAMARYGTVLLAKNLWGDRFPWGTLLANVAGCLVMGLAAAALPEAPEKTAATLWLRYGLMVGFLGAYTTFSAFSLETLQRLESGQPLLALANVLASVTLCLVATWLGLQCGRAFLSAG